MASGAALVLFSGIWLLEWHAGTTIVPELPFLPYRFHYDTAWAFALAGIALAAFAAGARPAVSACALVVMLIGAMRCLEQLVPGFDVGIYPLLANRWLPAGEYDDIPPLTGLGLIFAAGALLALKRPPYSAARSVIAALLALSTVALATTLMLGSQSRGRFLYGWLQLDSNDAVNALAFMLVAGSVLFVVFWGGGHEARAARRWAPLAVWLSVLIVSLMLWQALQLRQLRETLAGTQVVADAASIELTSELRERIRVLWSAADRWASSRMTREEVAAEAARVLNDVPEFRAIAWADSAFTPRWAVPAGSYALGKNLLDDTRRNAAVGAALSNRAPALTRALDLPDGQKGFHVYVPVYRDRALDGLLIGLVIHGAWMESVLADRFTQYSIALLENGQLIGRLRWSERALGGEWIDEKSLAVLNANWTLLLAPTQATLDASASVLPLITLVVGVLLATLLAFTVFLFQITLRRARDTAEVAHLLQIDIEARKQAESALRMSEQENRRVVEEARDFYMRLFSGFPNFVWRTDASGQLDYCNQAWLDFTGKTWEQQLGDGWLESMHPDDRAAWSEAIQRTLRANQPLEIQFRLRRGDGRYGWIVCTCRPYQNMRGEPAGILASCYDDTARRAMQSELEASRERMRSFSRHLQTAREEEKTRIARELHDELGATLTALRMDSSWLARRLAADDGTAQRRSQSIVQLADAAIRCIRRIITELRPSILDNLGLIAALRWQAKEFQVRTGIRVSVHAEREEVAVDKAQAVVFFRIFQETLTNVLKHARARNVAVHFRATAAGHVLEVTDDGVGMAESSALKETTHGILGMQERAREHNGELDVSSAPGRGTRVRVELPRPVQERESALA